MVRYPEFLMNYDEFRRYQADKFYVPWDQLSFENDIVGLQHVPGCECGVAPIFRNGMIAPVMWDDIATGTGIKESYIPVDSIIYRVVIFYFKRNTALFGMEFFDENGQLLLQAGCVEPDPDLHQHEIVLEPGDRLIGARSKMHNALKRACCYDF